jgi:hypothetical protein
MQDLQHDQILKSNLIEEIKLDNFTPKLNGDQLLEVNPKPPSTDKPIIISSITSNQLQQKNEPILMKKYQRRHGFHRPCNL